jgi:hypothetical protein
VNFLLFPIWAIPHMSYSHVYGSREGTSDFGLQTSDFRLQTVRINISNRRVTQRCNVSANMRNATCARTEASKLNLI